MHKGEPMSERKYRLTIAEHELTKRLIATSEDMPHLFVHGKTIEEIRTRAPRVIERVLKAQGARVAQVTLEPKAPTAPTHFVTKTFTVVATFAEAA